LNTSNPENKKESTNNTTVYISQAENFQNSPVTIISPYQGSFPDTTGAEAEFNHVCNNLKRPVQMVLKKGIIWSKKDLLHFWKSLAFTLKSEERTCVAVSSFVDKQGQIKLYIASNDPMNVSQQHEITEIINMFLDLKPVNEIAAKLLPRHLSYIIKQFDKISPLQLEAFTSEYPGELSKAIKTFLVKNISGDALTLDDIRPPIFKKNSVSFAKLSR
jgi:hypothetical protein